jgi:hypothetical protein
MILLFMLPAVAWDDRHVPPGPATDWDGISLTFCLG